MLRFQTEAQKCRFLIVACKCIADFVDAGAGAVGVAFAGAHCRENFSYAFSFRSFYFALVVCSAAVQWRSFGGGIRTICGIIRDAGIWNWLRGRLVQKLVLNFLLFRLASAEKFAHSPNWVKTIKRCTFSVFHPAITTESLFGNGENGNVWTAIRKKIADWRGKKKHAFDQLTVIGRYSHRVWSARVESIKLIRVRATQNSTTTEHGNTDRGWKEKQNWRFSNCFHSDESYWEKNATTIVITWKFLAADKQIQRRSRDCGLQGEHHFSSGLSLRCKWLIPFSHKLEKLKQIGKVGGDPNEQMGGVRWVIGMCMSAAPLSKGRAVPTRSCIVFASRWVIYVTNDTPSQQAANTQTNQKKINCTLWNLQIKVSMDYIHPFSLIIHSL